MPFRKKTPVPKTPEELRIEACKLAEKWAQDGVEAEAIGKRLKNAELGGLIERPEIFRIVRNARMVGSPHNDFSLYRLIQYFGWIALVVGFVLLLFGSLARAFFMIAVGVLLVRSPEAHESDI